MAREVLRRWQFPSLSDPNKIYVTQLNSDGMLSCNCPAWVFPKKGAPRECPHTRGIALQLRGAVREKQAEMNTAGDVIETRSRRIRLAS
jgi:hypothetical protein